MPWSQEDKLTCFLFFFFFLFSQASAKAPKCTIDFTYTYFTFFPSLQTHCSHSSRQMAVKDISVCSLSSQTCKQTDNQKLVSHSNENSRYWTWMEMLQPVWESRAPELPKTFTKCRQEPVGNNWAQMYEAANVSDQTFSLLQNKPGRVLQAGILQDRLIILSGTTANTIPEQKLCTKQPSREESTHPDGSELQRNFKECPCNPGWQQRGCCTWKNHQHSYT